MGEHGITEAMCRALYETRCPPGESPAGGFTSWARWDDVREIEGPRIKAQIEAALSAAPAQGPGREALAIALGAADGVKWDGSTVTYSHVPGSDDDGPTDRYFRLADAVLALWEPRP